MKETYTAVIIGCGSIGALKPGNLDIIGGKNVLTHAHAIYNEPRIKLIGVLDADREKTITAASKWGTSPFVIGCGQPDIVVCATPTSTHRAIINEVSSVIKPRVIIGEKPLGNSFMESSAISRVRTPIAVNYIRRYEPRHIEIASVMNGVGGGGTIYGCRVYYGRGLMHDGCHAMDLMRWWFGYMVSAQVTNLVEDSPFGTSYGFVARYQRCHQVVFTPVDSRKFGIFEIEVMTSIGKYSFIGNGTRLGMRFIKKGDDWGSYPVLDTSSIREKTQLTNAMTYLYKNVVGFLDGIAPLKCVPEDAAGVWDDYNKITESVK